MSEGLYKRVQAIARTRGMSDGHLGQLMVDRGLRYGPIYMDSFASPDDIRVIAEILQVPSSVLFEATNFIRDLIEAVVDDNWEQHESRIGISKQEALKKVMQSEYKWNSSKSIRNRVELFLKALEPPFGKVQECQYLDCKLHHSMRSNRAHDGTRGIELDWTSIRAKALDLAESRGLEYNDPDLPRTQLRRLATELGVDRLELHKMEGDALVVERTTGQYTVFLNSSHVRSRHRFTTAHEIAHLLASPIIAHREIHRRRFSPNQDPEGQRIEILCNDMASAILMPRKRVEALLDQMGPTARCIPSLIKNFDVSFEAAARRYVNVVPLPCSLIKWSMQAEVRIEERPISNFALGGGLLKFQRTPLSSSNDSGDINNVTVSKEDVTIYPGRYSRLAPIHVEEANVETLHHGRGQYRRMFSFIYLPGQVVKKLQFNSQSRMTRR